MIEVSNFSKSYGRFEAVKQVSFRVKKGEILGLLGPNGAGKSTILRALTGYHYPSSGTISIDGFDIQQNPQEAKALFGYLPEKVPLYENFTSLEYLQFVAQSRLLHDEKQAIDRVIDLCKLDSHIRHPIHALSKGFRQRLGLAQAIIHDPKVLILDEPSGGLDPNQILEFRRLLNNFKGSKSIIISSHVLQEIESICDRYLILNRGTVQAEGSREDLLGKASLNSRLIIETDGITASDIQKIKCVNNLIDLGHEEINHYRFEVYVSSIQEGRREIMKAFKDHEGIILGLEVKNPKLEDLFVELTQEVKNDN